MPRAFIAGVSGTTLTSDERDFFKDSQPAGLILFARNCESAAQIKGLIAAVREVLASNDFLVLIDQEGGRVQRLRPPISRALPPAAAYGQCYARDPKLAVEAAEVVAHLMATELRVLDINTDCAPVLDVPVPGAHDIIGDRAFGVDVEQIVVLAGAAARGFMCGGVLPVMKHIPGHGRATSDSHLDLPVVETSHAELRRSDFAPFQALNALPAAMTAHVVFSALDADAPASTSSRVTQDIIRGEIGFDGLLMSDDLSMKALSGPMVERAKAVIDAGSDLALHCNGLLAEMAEVAAGVPELSGAALRRFEAAIRVTQANEPIDIERAEGLLTCVMEHAVPAA